MGGQAGAARPPQLTQTGCSPPELSGPGMIQEVPSSNWTGIPMQRLRPVTQGGSGPRSQQNRKGAGDPGRKQPSGLTPFTNEEMGPGAKVPRPQNSPGRVRAGGPQPMPAPCSAPTENWHRLRRVSSGGPSQQQPWPLPLSFAGTAHQPTPAPDSQPWPPAPTPSLPHTGGADASAPLPPCLPFQWALAF